MSQKRLIWIKRDLRKRPHQKPIQKTNIHNTQKNSVCAPHSSRTQARRRECVGHFCEKRSLWQAFFAKRDLRKRPHQKPIKKTYKHNTPKHNTPKANTLLRTTQLAHSGKTQRVCRSLLRKEVSFTGLFCEKRYCLLHLECHSISVFPVTSHDSREIARFCASTSSWKRGDVGFFCKRKKKVLPIAFGVLFNLKLSESSLRTHSSREIARF